MKFYAVRNGRIPGVYQNWSDCNSQISGFPKAVYKSFQDHQSALDFVSFSISVPVNTAEIQSFNRVEHIKKVEEFDKYMTIYVDGGFNKNTKPDAWGCVVNCTGQDLILYNKHLLSDINIKNVFLPVGQRDVIVCRFGGSESQQNNGAELMATVAGLRIAIFYIRNGFPVKHIASDSKLVVEFWSKYIKKESVDTFDHRKVAYIRELISLRKIFEDLGGSIIKISGDENPADLGYHVSK